MRKIRMISILSSQKVYMFWGVYITQKVYSLGWFYVWYIKQQFMSLRDCQHMKYGTIFFISTGPYKLLTYLHSSATYVSN